MDSWSFNKIMEFPQIWPFTCHKWVKYWPMTNNNTANRDYSARAINWSFPRSSTTLRLETPGGRTSPNPLSGRRWQNTKMNRLCMYCVIALTSHLPIFPSGSLTLAGTRHFAILHGTGGGGGYDPPRVWLLSELEHRFKKPACCLSRCEAVDTRI